MLSMMTGMVPAHTGGTGVGLDERTTRVLLGELELRQRELENLRRQLREAASKQGMTPENDKAVNKITQELIDNMRRIESVKRAQRANAANTGKLSPEELLAKLEVEARKRLELEIKLRDQKLDAKSSYDKLTMTREILDRERQRLADTEKKLTETSEAERSANAELRKLASDYRKIQKELGNAEAEKRLSDQELADARNAIAAKEADLAGVKNALREMNTRIGKVSLERQELQRSLAFTTGKLNTAERTNADFKGQLRKLERTAAQQQIELATARQEKAQMETLVKRSLKDLAEAQKVADASKLAAKHAEGKLAATEQIIKQITAKPAAEAFKRYAGAAFKLNYIIKEKAMLLERSVADEYVLVLVQAGKKTIAVAPFDILIGATGKNLLYKNIETLSYTFSPPDSKVSKSITSPLLAYKSKQGDMLGAFELSVPGRTALKFVTREQLMARGTDDLFLFSCRKFGRNSAALVGRCSLDPRKDSPYLVIRNDKSRHSGQLQAELGDIVITRDGGFVGVVTGFDKETSSEAKVLLTSDMQLWEKAHKIPLVKKSGADGKGTFGEGVRQFKPLNRR